ncbi:metal ABC transporter ATP-binding protein [Bailinhaonella thermotolerans]|uniref:Metal ABC transporter ATP-binding protein n=1 Tax=Bailinhaonella thermotolerans TaxID=1070861 RepID=A0A3A4A3R6_9ACTN|nr:metal ABC transporter ATP-binding protein [Bailinhaonella thermotolerans]RJL21495.1 metal ABC transporter ATP-binding protein [Bailinhaonella thermotolerans]
MTGGRVSLDTREVLRGVDLTVEPGEVVAVLGPNGSGKSTLVRSLLGLVPLTAGSVELYGVPPRRFRDWKRVGYVPQRLTAGGGVPATIREVVASGRIARQKRLRPASAADRAAVDRALRAVSLADRAGDPVHALSGGQQQRVLIARALAGEPDVYVMDEPTAGVDAATQQALAGTLRTLAAEGRTVVLVAHELGPLASVITRAVVVTDGLITQDGPPSIAAAVQEHCHPHADEDVRVPLSGWKPTP